MKISAGIYEKVLDTDLAITLSSMPDLHAILAKIDPEEAPEQYARFTALIIKEFLRCLKPEERLSKVNAIISGIEALQADKTLPRIAEQDKHLLKALVREPRILHFPRPITPIDQSSLFTGASADPALHAELCLESATADHIDILVSFIKTAGMRLLHEALRDAGQRGVVIRVITTSYMGASDFHAVVDLARIPGVQVRVSYDTERTRLHAKAWHFRRESGFSTAYIGSSNISHSAMTSGLEWNLKISEQSDPHIIEKFRAEFETYWHSSEFIPFNPDKPEQLKEALSSGRLPLEQRMMFFDLKPHPFQERILDSINNERQAHGYWRNLVIAATGTGKTMIAAFDYRNQCSDGKRPKLLFVAHRREILEQSMFKFRAVLHDANFGDMYTGLNKPGSWDNLFCSIDMLNSKKLWAQLGPDYFEYIVVDEVHHGAAQSYRPIFDNFKPRILLGLTATPERMDGQDIRVDFHGRFAAEIRLPEALEEQLLCPFQYFGVSDPVSLRDNSFWRNGTYGRDALERVYTGDDIRARQRVETLFQALDRYQPDWRAIDSGVRAIGFCVSVVHAQYMSNAFLTLGIKAGVIVGATPADERELLTQKFRSGEISFVFTVDVWAEGVDIPEVNTIIMLRPTESLTVFLQQLGRGLRRSPGKDCVTVLDLVGQHHQQYRLDTKYIALLKRQRFDIEREVEENFPHLPPGCAIHLEKVAKQQILGHIRETLKQFKPMVLERIRGHEKAWNNDLTFKNFIEANIIDPRKLLSLASWPEWKHLAGKGDLESHDLREVLKPAYTKMLRTTSVNTVKSMTQILSGEKTDSENAALLLRRVFGEKLADQTFADQYSAFKRIGEYPQFINDAKEILDWVADNRAVYEVEMALPFSHSLVIHGEYDNLEIQTAVGKIGIEDKGQRGVGVLHFESIKTYAILITFQKSEAEFSPSTMYADYPISRTCIHWQSQSDTTQASLTGQRLCNLSGHGYTLLVFARSRKKEAGIAAPFVFLGSAIVNSFSGNRPISFELALAHPMPVDLFEENRRGG